MPVRLHKAPVKGKARPRIAHPRRDTESQPLTRHLSDRTLKEFVATMKGYAAQNNLGKPTLLFAQTPHHFGICLKWTDDQRAFSLLKGAWTADDYGRVCDLFRAW